MTDPCIDILMATYNGQNYIKTQILSIIGQTYENWRLIIHDDGSQDDTIRIIERLQEQENRIMIIRDEIRFKNPQQNFMHLLKYSSNDLICFCDQDDIWCENKLRVLVQAFIGKTIHKPVCLFSNAYLLYPGNIITGNLGYRYNSLKEYLFVNGGIHGCRSMFNQSMRDNMLRFSGYLDMHDHLLSLIALSFGEIYYLNEKLFLYRQHTNNVSGKHIVSPIKRIRNAFKDFSSRGLFLKESYTFISNFYQVYKESFSTYDKKTIEAYLNMYHHGRIHRTLKIISLGFSLGGNRFQLIIKSLFFPAEA